MSNILPRDSKVTSDQQSYRTVADFNLVRKLMQENALYEIPQHLRETLIEQSGTVLQSTKSTDAEKLSAAKLLLEADKRNIDLIKTIIPKKVEHFNARDATDAELVEIIQDAQGRLSIPDNGGTLAGTGQTVSNCGSDL